MNTETMPDRQDHNLSEWPLRPWALAGLLALAGLCVHFLTDGGEDEPWRMALTGAVIFGALAAGFTASPGRWKAPAIYAGLVALVMGGIAWRASSAGERYSDAEFWVAAGVIATALSLPLFQAGFHRLRLKTSYKATHFHIWTDAITGAGALAFTGLSWALIALLAELFAVIEIDLLKDLLGEEWFGWTFSGAAFGAGLGVLRNQLGIIGTLQNVVLVVLSILAVPLAAALVIFLLAVLVSGIDVLWEATRSATPLLLAIAVGCFVLANAVVRDEDAAASRSRVLGIAGFVLALGILPLSAMAAVSMGTRIAQHGLSPERLWALVAIAVAVAYGVAYFVSAIRGRREGWRGYLRRSNLHLAVMTAGIALLLALPVFNFGAISASNQIARLEAGAVNAEDFDYSALRWDFGDAGRAALARLAQSDDRDLARRAASAAAQETRSYALREGSGARDARLANLRMEFDDAALRSKVEAAVRNTEWTCRSACVAIDLGVARNGPRRVAVVSQGRVRLLDFDMSATSADMAEIWVPTPAAQPDQDADSVVEIREWSGRRVYIDGKPAGAPFD